MLPPPPPPPPPLQAPCKTQESAAPEPSANRNALLSRIRKGAKLKKAVTNDRSSPIVNDKGRSSSDSSKEGSPAQGGGKKAFNGNMLAGLFAQGMPKLRATNNSFLQGGNYKSQLNPRETIKRRSLSKSCDDLGTDSPVQSLLANQECKNKERCSSNADVNGKANSIQNLNTSCGTNGTLQKPPLAAQVDSKFQPPEPPPANRKPSFGNKSFPSRSFLHNDELGGSEPNLNTNVKLRPKPVPQLPMPSSSTSCEKVPGKPTINSKSYEDSDVPDGMQTSAKSEKFLERLKYSTVKNSSMPNDLNGTGFGNDASTLPIAPLRKYNRSTRPVKPSVAPPPLPPGARASTPAQQANVRQIGTPRPRPPPPPVMSPPPPPPPRNLKNTLTIHRNMKLAAEDDHEKHDDDSPSGLESRFQFKSNFEFPKPEPFLGVHKTYPSKAATRPRKERCQPPPNAPPPPPSMANLKR